MIRGRGLSPGKATSEVLICDQYISPLGEISREGIITSGPCENASLSGKIFAFRRGRGSTVGSYTFLELKSRKLAPAGIINESAEQMVVTGAIISEIPMVDKIPLDIFSKGDIVTIDGDNGEVSIEGVSKRRVATVYLMHQGKLLLLKRSYMMKAYPGQYGGISGYIEEGESPEDTGRREMAEECGIRNATLKEKGVEIYVRDGKLLYEITPMLMETELSEISLNEENTEFMWVGEEELQKHDTVPKFKETFYSLVSSARTHF